MGKNDIVVVDCEKSKSEKYREEQKMPKKFRGLPRAKDYSAPSNEKALRANAIREQSNKDLPGNDR